LSLLLQTNNTLKELYLSENRLGNEGTEILSDGLVHNCSIQKLDLRSNGIELGGSIALSSFVKKCKTLTSLCLAMNEIGDVGVGSLAEGLKDKKCHVEDLDLSDNGISEEGALAVSDMLLENSRLQSLNLSFNSIGGNGASSIAYALDRNNTLRRLCLRRNNIDNIGAAAFAAMLPTMRGLKELSMTNNPIDQEGSAQLLEGLRNNVDLIYMQVGDTKSVQILKEIFHWIRLNQAGRRVFRDSNLPLAIWPYMLSRLTKDTDVMYHFLSQKPDMLEPVRCK
jgi:Ran GTPase-activating protein (RanGAP) involved in mRNA processing and transport